MSMSNLYNSKTKNTAKNSSIFKYFNSLPLHRKFMLMLILILKIIQILMTIKLILISIALVSGLI
jgi:hypothetical protein